MAVSDIDHEILELVDEDYYGVWEVGWRLSTALNNDPSIDPEEAAEAVSSLRKRGAVEIYVREWVDDPPQAVALSGRAIDLGDPTAWREPQPGQPQFLIGAPGDGEGEHA